MKQVVNKAVLFSSLHFASAIISIKKCCPLGEALDQLGACQKVLVDHFKEEVFVPDNLYMGDKGRVQNKK